MKKSDRAKKHTGKVIEAAARAHEALDYFNGNVTNPFDELTWPSIAEGYLLVAQKAVSDALVALERATSVGWTKHGPKLSFWPFPRTISVPRPFTLPITSPRAYTSLQNRRHSPLPHKLSPLLGNQAL